jgi:hypothetical protein
VRATSRYPFQAIITPQSMSLAALVVYLLIAVGNSRKCAPVSNGRLRFSAL